LVRLAGGRSISLVVWIGQRKLQKEANDLQRFTAELSRRQLLSIEKADLESKIANIDVDIEEGDKCHWVTITNFGPSTATDVSLSLPSGNVDDSPFFPEELEAKFPKDRLIPSGRVAIRAIFFLESAVVLTVQVAWTDGTGKNAKEFKLSL
jgi:hypothetical protein